MLTNLWTQTFQKTLKIYNNKDQTNYLTCWNIIRRQKHVNCLASARATLPLSPLTNLPSVTKFGLNLRIFRLCIFWCVFFSNTCFKTIFWNCIFRKVQLCLCFHCPTFPARPNLGSTCYEWVAICILSRVWNSSKQNLTNFTLFNFCLDLISWFQLLIESFFLCIKMIY